MIPPVDNMTDPTFGTNMIAAEPIIYGNSEDEVKIETKPDIKPFSEYEPDIYKINSQMVYTLRSGDNGWNSRWRYDTCGVSMVNSLMEKELKWGVPLAYIPKKDRGLKEFSNWVSLICEKFGIKFSDPEIIELSPRDLTDTGCYFIDNFHPNYSLGSCKNFKYGGNMEFFSCNFKMDCDLSYSQVLIWEQALRIYYSRSWNFIYKTVLQVLESTDDLVSAIAIASMLRHSTKNQVENNTFYGYYTWYPNALVSNKLNNTTSKLNGYEPGLFLLIPRLDFGEEEDGIFSNTCAIPGRLSEIYDKHYDEECGDYELELSGSELASINNEYTIIKKLLDNLDLKGLVIYLNEGHKVLSEDDMSFLNNTDHSIY